MPSAMLLKKIYKKISKSESDDANIGVKGLQRPINTDANNTYQSYSRSQSEPVRVSLNRKRRGNAFRVANKSKRHPVPTFTDPEHVTPQESKQGYLYKREGLHDFRTKRHFRLSQEGGLKTYKTEQDNNSSHIDEVPLDFMRCEVLPGVPDTLSPPRYYFTLKSDDLSGKSYFLAAESDYERKKWMVSVNKHIDDYRQPSVLDISIETRIYLNIREDESSEGSDSEPSSADEFNNSESSGEIYAPVAMSRIVPAVVESHIEDDEIYGEFDAGLPEPGPVQDLTASIRLASVGDPMGPRKVSTAPCHFLKQDTVPRVELDVDEDLYMGAGDIAVTPLAPPPAPRAIFSPPSSVSQDLDLSNIIFSDDDIYADGFSLPAVQASPPSIPGPPPPSAAPPPPITSLHPPSGPPRPPSNPPSPPSGVPPPIPGPPPVPSSPFKAGPPTSLPPRPPL